MVTTDGTGNATITFPAGLFTAAPVLALTAVSTGGNQGFFAEIVSVSATQATIRTWRGNTGLMLVGGTYAGSAVAATVPVHVAAFEAS